MLLRFACSAALALAIITASARAQAIRGTTRATGTNEPIPGVVLLLEDAEGRTIARALSDAGGRFALVARDGGPVALRTLRLGYRTVSTRFVLSADTSLSLHLTAIPTLLPAVAAAEAECRLNPATGSVAGELWEAVRTALYATDITSSASRYQFRVQSSTRTTILTPFRSDTIATEEREVRGRFPWSSVPTDSIARVGYVMLDGAKIVYNAPDITVLLSSTFTAGHCFAINDRVEPGWIGLRFAPVGDDALTDVHGTLYLDRTTRELRRFDFLYTNLRHTASDTIAGGRMEFTRLPTGDWLPTGWSIRAPVPSLPSVMQLHRTSDADANGRVIQRPLGARDKQFIVAGSTTTETQVVHVRSDANPDSVIWQRPVGSIRAEISVPVFGGLPTGAMLRVVGFDRIALANLEGVAEFRDLLPGWYEVEVASPLEDSLRVPGARRRMLVRADFVSVVKARLRNDEAAREAACPDQRSLPIVGGELLSGTTPLAGALLTLLPTRPLTGPDLLLTTQDRTDSRGRFRLCGLRLGETFLVKIKTADGATDERRLRLDAMPAGRLHWMTIVLPP